MGCRGNHFKRSGAWPGLYHPSRSHRARLAFYFLLEFWSSPLNFRGPRKGPPAADKAAPHTALDAVDCGTPQEGITPLEEFCAIRTRSPLELDCGPGRGALCFINPLFLQEQPPRGAPHRRHQFQRSLKVRVSTETSSPLSPPAAPPPPPPLLAKGTRHKAPKGEGNTRSPSAPSAPPEEESEYLQPSLQKRAGPGVCSFRRTPALSPTVEEDDYQSPKALSKVPGTLAVLPITLGRSAVAASARDMKQCLFPLSEGALPVCEQEVSINRYEAGYIPDEY